MGLISELILDERMKVLIYSISCDPFISILGEMASTFLFIK